MKPESSGSEWIRNTEINIYIWELFSLVPDFFIIINVKRDRRGFTLNWSWIWLTRYRYSHEECLNGRVFLRKLVVFLWRVFLVFELRSDWSICRSAAWETLAEEVNTQDLVALAEEAYELWALVLHDYSLLPKRLAHGYRSMLCFLFSMKVGLLLLFSWGILSEIVMLRDIR